MKRVLTADINNRSFEKEKEREKKGMSGSYGNVLEDVIRFRAALQSELSRGGKRIDVLPTNQDPGFGIQEYVGGIVLF